MQILIFVFALVLNVCWAQKKVILVSLDGFRHDYIEKALAASKNVSAFIELTNNGFRAKEVQSVMVSLTFPSHVSLATGRNVETHGIVGNTFWDPDMKEKYHYTDAKKNLNPAWFTKYGNEPLWLTNQRNGGKTGVFYWPTSDARIYDEMMYTSFGLYDGTPTLKFRVDRVMDWISQDDVNLVMMYFNEPDSTGHSHGPDSKEVLDQVEKTNDGIAYLLQRIKEDDKLKDNVNVIVTSDHGMATVNHKKTVDVYKVLDPDQYLFGVDNSPANMGVWPKDGGPTVEQMYAKLKELNNCDVYLREELPEEYHYKHNDRIAPIVILPHVGWMVQNNGSYPYKDTLNGMHGYNSFKRDMHPFLVAAGPGIKKHEKMVDTFYQIDVYPLVCLLLGHEKPNKIDGKMERVLPFLKVQPSKEFQETFEKYATGVLVDRDPKPDGEDNDSSPNSSMVCKYSVLFNLYPSVVEKTCCIITIFTEIIT